jgi:hypothetical protein
MRAGVNGGRHTVNINRYYCAKTTSVVAKYIFIWGVLMVKWLERPTLISMFRGSNPKPVIGIFLKRFHHFCNFGTIRTLNRWKPFPLSSVKNNWLAQLPCFHHVCEWVCMKDTRSWGLFRPEHSGGIVSECVPLPSNYASLPCIAGPLVWNVREWKIRSGVHWFVR